MSERYLTFDGKRTSIAVLQWGKVLLSGGGIEDYAVSVEVLLSHVLNKSRSEILLDSESILTEKEISEYQQLLDRRLNREPLQYITGVTEFYNVIIKCDKRALIPRPETEILCDYVINTMKTSSNASILDIGTGTGNIAITLAKNLAGSRLTSVDVSGDATDLANENARLNEVDNKIDFKVGDIFDDCLIDLLGKYDCIVSNPPYVGEDEKGILQPEVIEHEPHQALFSGDDNLVFYKRISEISGQLLESGGILAMEMGLGQSEKIVDIMAGSFSDIDIIKDLAGIKRVITGLKK